MSGFLSASDQLLVFESQFWNGEFSFLAGIDEAGRGCLAGPVVAAAVVFTDHTRIPAGLNDSKQLTESRREELREQLLNEPSVKWGIGEVSAEEIDRSDILRATWKAMALAVAQVIPPTVSPSPLRTSSKATPVPLQLRRRAFSQKRIATTS